MTPSRSDPELHYKGQMTDSRSISFAVAGAAGRMGRQLTASILDAGHKIAGGTVAAESQHLGSDIGILAGRETLGMTPMTDPVQAAATANVWLDFTAPAVTLAALESLKHTAVRAVIIGTTGFDNADLAILEAAAERLAIVKSGNFSLGVTLLTELVRTAAERLGPDWDVEIAEMHHRRKVDAPSGTALALGDAAANGRGADLGQLQAGPYDGPDARRISGQIGFSVRRGGGVVGAHDVTFANESELLTLGHMALDRSVFAEGAVHAALWAVRQKPGLYTMADVLGF